MAKVKDSIIGFSLTVGIMSALWFMAVDAIVETDKLRDPERAARASVADDWFCNASGECCFKGLTYCVQPDRRFEHAGAKTKLEPTIAASRLAH